jgi:hypothetical protein
MSNTPATRADEAPTMWQAAMGVVFDDQGQELGRFTCPAHAILAAAAPELLAKLTECRLALQSQLELLVQSCTNPKTGLADSMEDQLSIQSDQDFIDGIDELIVAAGGTIVRTESEAAHEAL